MKYSGENTSSKFLLTNLNISKYWSKKILNAHGTSIYNESFSQWLILFKAIDLGRFLLQYCNSIKPVPCPSISLL